jgi:hypothetical protein
LNLGALNYVSADPPKPKLDQIDRELEDAMTRLNESNRRVDQLLTEFGAAGAGEGGTADGEGPAAPAPPESPEESPEPPAEL